MATKPDQARRNHEAELTAAAMLARRYDLPNLLRATKVRPRPFRKIVPTNALYSAMARPYLELVKAWAARRPALLAAYAEALRVGSSALITRRLDEIAADIARTVSPSFQAAAAQLERWHRGQWVKRIDAATGLNVGALTSPADVAQASSEAIVWNGQLHADVHAQILAGIAAAALAAYALRTRSDQVGKQLAPVLARAKKRGLAIGVDQVDRTSRAFDRERAAAAGLGRFVWHHSAHVKVPRPEHLARDGRIYSQSNAPNDRAGVLYGCQCWEEPLFD